MNKKIVLLSFIAVLLLSSCGGKNKPSLAERASGDMESYESGDVNAIQQALPQIIILPSDMVLKNFGCLKEESKNGRTYVIRDYQKYLRKDDRFKRILSTIQSAFARNDYPLADFEQNLKQMDTQEATDMADGLEKDAKTMLLTTAQPDIIIELNYDTSRDKFSMVGHNYSGRGEKNVSYTLNAIDAYTNKVVSSTTASNIKGTSTTETIQKDIEGKLPALMNDITDYFSDILKRGRDITVRVAVESGSNTKLSDESINGDVYSDWIVDYVKTHTIKGAYKMQRNTNVEMYFVNCRIKLLNDDGTQYGVYDWARDFSKSIRTNLGLKVQNKSQGLGEVLLVVKGI